MTPADREAREEYERGYNNGYRAGRNFKAVTYRRYHWRCITCDRFGVALLRSDESAEKGKWRIAQSHDGHSRGRCEGANLVELSDVEYQRAAKGIP